MDKTKFIPNKQLANLSVALYSVSQDCFHIETLSDYIVSNLRKSYMKYEGDCYRLIGIFNSDVEAGDYIEIVRQQLNNGIEKQKTKQR